MPSLTFKELKKALDEHNETILALREAADGGIEIVRDYGEGTEHSVALSMAKIHKKEHPYAVFIRAL